MTETQTSLWDAIENFELDDPEDSMTFTDRLARENDWSTIELNESYQKED